MAISEREFQLTARDLEDRIIITNNIVRDNIDNYGIAAYGQVLVTGNTVSGHTNFGIYLISSNHSQSAEASDNVVYGNTTGIYSYSGTVRNNRVYANRVVGIQAAHYTLAEGNVVYSNRVGIFANVTWVFGTQLVNNLIYANTNQGILISGSAFYSNPAISVTNNTIYQPTGDAIRIENNTDNITLRSNILWAESGYAINVADDSQLGFSSDYNTFYTTGGGKLAYWQTRSISSLADWFYELGADQHSQTTNPNLIDPNGSDDLLGYNETPLAAGVVFNDSVTTSPSVVSWRLRGLTPGEFYRLGATWVPNSNLSPAAGYEVYDGDTLLGVLRFNQQSTPNGFSDADKSWARLGVFRATGTELTVRLVNTVADQQTAADAVIVQHVHGDRGLDDIFAVPAGSSTIDAGDPTSDFQNEPMPNGGRVNQGHTGNTARAITSPSLVVQVLGPNGLEKLESGQQVTITWSSDGINQVASYSASILTDSPLGYWRLGEISGTTATDATGNNHVGNYLNGVTLGEAGAIDNDTNTAAGFDGVDDSVSIPDSIELRPTQLSVEAWVRPDADGSFYGSVLSKSDNLFNGYGLFQYGGPGKLRFFINYYLQYVETTIPVGEWSHIVGTYNGTEMNLYVNGKLVNTLAVSVAISHSTQPLEIGSTSGNYFWRGGIDEVAVYGQALTAKQVREHYTHLNYGTADIELMQGNNPTPVATIATATRNDGDFTWTVPNLVGNDYRIRVRGNALTSPQDASDGVFLITNSANHYYVNDNSTDGDVFTTAVGNNANGGKSPDRPMASLAALLNAYDLDAGDVIHVDAGTYNLLNNIKLLPDDSGVRIEGPMGATAVFNRGNTSTGSYVIEFAGADDVTIDQLSLTGGEFGAYATYTGGSDRLMLSRSSIFGNRQDGINLSGTAKAVVSENLVYGNGYSGITASGPGLVEDRIVITDNTVRDNVQYGINVNGQVLVTGNTVYGHTASSSAGIIIFNGNNLQSAEALDNAVYGNATGIYSYFGKVRNNRVFANSVVGINARDNTLVEGNVVYSNPVGIVASLTYVYDVTLVNNLVYTNTNQGILIVGSFSYTTPVISVTNNTIYQPTGDAIRIENNTENVKLRNNIVWIEAGYAINVADDSQVGFDSDYNILNRGVVGSTGIWNGVVRSSLADWRAAMLANPTELDREEHSLAGDPLFADLDGADNVLGYTTSRGGYDGGQDDNFYRIKRSIAIDSGEIWSAPDTDIEGFARRDDPGTPNSGSPGYEVTSLGNNLFSRVGTGRDWHSHNLDFTLPLPFHFPFYGSKFDNVSVSTEGFLELAGSSNVGIIAPLWDDYHTLGAGDDIFVDSTIAGQLTIRWDATNANDGSDVNFSVTLFVDGRIRFDYGTGNTNLRPTVGISRGDGRFSLQTAYDGRSTLTGVDSIEFILTQANSYVDIGAFEFRGSSLDDSPPTVASVTPTFITNEGSADATFDTITVQFSEDVNPIDARASANYELRHTGLDGIFDNSDDLIFALTAAYNVQSFVTTLGVTLPGGRLSAGSYRFSVFGSLDRSIHDLAGLRLDGDNSSSTASSSYVRNFTVGNLPPTLEPIPDQIAAEGALLTINAVARDNDVGDALTYDLEAGSPAGTTIHPNTGVFFWTPNESQGPGTYTITVRVTDSGSPQKSDLKTFKVSVLDVNAAPILAPIGNRSVEEGTTLQIQAIASDLDLPLNSLTFSLIGAPTGASIDPTTGLLNWTPREEDGPGSFVFKVRVTDDGTPTLFAEEQITVVVDERNTSPTLNRLLNRSVRQGDLLTFMATAQDIDIPNDTLRFSLDTDSPVGATIDAVTGVFSWTPTQAGTYNLTVRVTDDGVPPLSAFQLVTITVFPVNVAPVIAAIGNKAIDEQSLLDFTAIANDGNSTDTLTFSLINAPQGATIDPATGVFRWTPTEEQGSGSFTVRVRVADNGSPTLFDEEEVLVTVREVNQPPVLDPISNKVFNEGTNRSFAVTARDADRPNNNLRFSLIGAPDGATIDPLTGLFSWTPTEAQGPALYSVTVRVTDDGLPALFAEQQIVLTVNEVNLPPVITPILDRTTAVGGVLRFTATAADPDLTPNQLRFSLIDAPPGASIDELTGQFEWIPTDAGTYTFLVRVTDDGPVNLFDQASVTITTVGTTISASNAVVTGNVLATLNNTGSFGALNPVLVSLSASLGTVVKNDNGTWDWSLNSSIRLQNHVVTITASDGLSSSSVTFNVNAQVNISSRAVYYKGSSFSQSGNNVTAALDTTKTLVQSGTSPKTLGFANLSNNTRGLNGIVLDVAGLDATSLSNTDFVFRMSPTGLFNEAANPPSVWAAAPSPTNIVVTPGNATTPARVRLEWNDNAIANRWLQIQVLANANTSLSATQVYYFGHLQGEVNGQVLGGAFFVTTQDQSAVLPLGIANVSNPRDMDKNGFVTTQDLTAVRNSINSGRTLRVITIPASGSLNEGAVNGGQNLVAGNLFAVDGNSDLIAEGEANLASPIDLKTHLGVISDGGILSVAERHQAELLLDDKLSTLTKSSVPSAVDSMANPSSKSIAPATKQKKVDRLQLVDAIMAEYSVGEDLT